MSDERIRRIVDETVSRAEQACRYAVKHQNFSGTNPDYESGFEIGANVCEAAIAAHVARHYHEIIKADSPTELVVRVGRCIICMEYTYPCDDCLKAAE